MTRSIKLLAAAAALAIGTGSAHAGTSPGRNGIVGTWLASYDGGVHIGYIQFQQGGTLWDMMDFAPKTGNLLMGDWTTDGRGTYTVTVAGWTYDDKGNTRNGYFTKTEDENLSVP